MRAHRHRRGKRPSCYKSLGMHVLVAPPGWAQSEDAKAWVSPRGHFGVSHGGLPSQLCCHRDLVVASPGFVRRGKRERIHSEHIHHAIRSELIQLAALGHCDHHRRGRPERFDFARGDTCLIFASLGEGFFPKPKSAHCGRKACLFFCGVAQCELSLS